MTISVGDFIEVKFEDVVTGSDLGNRIDACLSKHAYQLKNRKAYRGTVYKVKTHTFFGWIKLAKPTYWFTLDIYPDVGLCTHKAKKVIRC